ncbi:WXG100 family type VII secretion target [Nocardioides insulae]|uniref:WXG100 family type VII secretion target n=1 Tax=Nocardioides insulae TaxID=394734 RepID=UPI00049104E5|nr:WXG100 family type VII secretion target [Nocardioides insulae]
MNDGILVNHGGLEQVAADLATGVKKIEQRLDRLENELAPLKSDWEGNAQAAYHQAKAKWDQAINEMQTLLAQTGTAVQNSNQEYAAADKRGAAAFGG